MGRVWERLPGRPPVLAGVIHLLPLPGSPRSSPGLAAVVERAVSDARALADGGFDLAIVENLGDAPYAGAEVGPAVVAAMTRVALQVRERAPGLALGINVLRNDALAALGIAAAVGAELVRINVHTGAMVTDQGVLQGRARETLLERNRLGATVGIAADVRVKHAQPLGLAFDLRQSARDTFLRGSADVLLVTGSGTGSPASPEDLRAVQEAVPGAPVWVASGVSPANAAEFPADGFVVGTWLHERGDLAAPLDPTRIAAMRRAVSRPAARADVDS